MPNIHLSSKDALILSSNCYNEYSCLFWLPAILSELVSTSISATPTPLSAALLSLGPLTYRLYHVLLLLYWHHRIPTTEFIYICMYSKTDFCQFQFLLSKTEKESSRKEAQGSYAYVVLNGQLKPRLPLPSAVHSSALSQNWLLYILSGITPQATACKQLHGFCPRILITFFKSTYLYC